MAFYVIAAMFAAQTRSIVGAMPEIRKGMRAFREVHELLACADREPYSGTRRVARIDHIRFDNVYFSYPDGPPLLEDVSLSITRGARVVLFGANGSGKTSLVHLIGGYYRPDRGRLCVNGIGYDEIDLRSLRARTAVVPQNPLLFAGTLGQNLLYGCGPEEKPEQAILEALDASDLQQFVDQLPEGLETPVGDQGIRLSGGQRQRLAIARALLRRPDLLIFDEPTNHLDETAIENLSASLRRLPFQPAVLLISHEPRILRHADVAWRLENGRLEPAGHEARL
jgi:ABC-type multidrug transport system fused ATPase/permease subunit